MNRSQQASRYGRLAEEYAAEKYSLTIDHQEIRGVRADARAPDGSPVDVKAAMADRKNGPGRFRLWLDQHEILEQEGGAYVFVRYRTASDGIAVLNSKSASAQSVRVDWGGSGDHRRNSPQAKILAKSVFVDN